ncbi:thiamine pyrophosphokinase [Aspergillus alliaceus]|uniref:Thiamine pyrophosphokinase n=1 Tax=Petromyces alliaceus TaxID=209559 RepID=A0A8H6A6L0_PETAA|nr:thiamine pyrophosphokinase [Aspergillus burnettii]
MNNLLDVVKDCDNFPYAEDTYSAYEQLQGSLWKFYIPEDPRPHGLMVDYVVERMPWTADFRVLPSPKKEVHLIRPEGSDWQEKCTEIIERQVELAREKGVFPKLGKKRHEQFPIVGANFPVGIDRSFFSYLGTVGRGVHLTVYTRTESGLKFWIPQRHPNKVTYGGMLDNTVAGGMALGEQPLECLIREASEEAGMSEELIRKNVRAAGTVNWVSISDERTGGQTGLINPGVLFVYDLEVDSDMVFKPVDDDVYAFHLMDTDQVKKAMLNRKFKPASASVVVDFFVRHGIITAEDEEDYTEIVSRLHRKLPLPTSSRV